MCGKASLGIDPTGEEGGGRRGLGCLSANGKHSFKIHMAVSVLLPNIWEKRLPLPQWLCVSPLLLLPKMQGQESVCMPTALH